MKLSYKFKKKVIPSDLYALSDKTRVFFWDHFNQLKKHYVDAELLMLDSAIDLLVPHIRLNIKEGVITDYFIDEDVELYTLGEITECLEEAVNAGLMKIKHPTLFKASTGTGKTS